MSLNWGAALVGGGKYTLDRPLVDFLRGLSPTVDVSALVASLDARLTTLEAGSAYTGVAGQIRVFDSAIGLASVSNSGAGSLLAITHDGFGRITGTTDATITGTADRITVTNGNASAGVPTLTIAVTYPGQTSIVTLGTVTTGEWQATAIGAAYGGTGQVTYTVGDILYASGATALSRLAAGTATHVLTSNGAGVAPSWQAAAAGYTDEQAQDAIGAAIAAGSQSGITVTYNDGSNSLDFTVTGGSGDAVSFAVAQVAHGFSVGHIVQLTGGTWAVADRDAGSTVADAVVSAVADADNFTATMVGKVTATTGQWDARTGDVGGLTAGEYYWTSGTAGGLTKTQSTTGIAQCVGVALSTTVLLVNIGEAVESATANANLAAIAAQVTAADKLSYWTGAGTAGLADFPSAARTALATLASGTYTPTLTNTTNIAASTAFACQYLRVGNTVTVSGRVNIDPTAGSVATLLGMSLPIASNFASVFQAGGTAVCTDVASLCAGIIADTVNDRVSFTWVHTADASNRAWSFSFTYVVI